MKTVSRSDADLVKLLRSIIVIVIVLGVLRRGTRRYLIVEAAA